MPFDLTSNLPFLLYRIASKLGSDANAAFKTAGVTTMYARILLALLYDDNSTVGDLCAFTAIDQSTMSHSLNALRRLELISKRRLARDNRTVRVRLTPKGLETARRCSEIASGFNQMLARGLSDEEIVTLTSSLRRLYDNCGQREHAPLTNLSVSPEAESNVDPTRELRTAK